MHICKGGAVSLGITVLCFGEETVFSVFLFVLWA